MSMDGYFGRRAGAGGGRPLRATCHPRTNGSDDLQHPSIPSVRDYLNLHNPPPPPPGLSLDSTAQLSGSFTDDSFDNQDTAMQVGAKDAAFQTFSAPPGLELPYTPSKPLQVVADTQQPASLPLLLGRLGLGSSAGKGMQDCIEKPASSAAPPGKHASPPLPPGGSPPGGSPPGNSADLQKGRRELLALLAAMQSNATLALPPPQSYRGLADVPEIVPPHYWAATSPCPVDLTAAMACPKHILSTLAPHPAPSQAASVGSQPLLDFAAPDFSAGLPAAATIAAMQRSAAMGISVPRRDNEFGNEKPSAHSSPASIARCQGYPATDTWPFSFREAADPIAALAAATALGTTQNFSAMKSAVPYFSHELASDGRAQPTFTPLNESSSAVDASPFSIGESSPSDSLACGFDAAIPDQEQQLRRGRRLACKFVFTGIDLERDADFELVPRLIGRGGGHMRQVAEACRGKVRIRGRGSGHKEQQKGGRPPVEADVPLQIALSCKDRRGFEQGKALLTQLLDGMCLHFERYCKRHGIDPVPPLYTVTG